jgi:hypothetical protein
MQLHTHTFVSFMGRDPGRVHTLHRYAWQGCVRYGRRGTMDTHSDVLCGMGVLGIE